MSYPQYPQQPSPQQPYGGVPGQPTQPGYPPPGYAYPPTQAQPAGYPPPPAYYPPPVPPPQKGGKAGWVILSIVVGLALLCGGVVVAAVVWANRAVHNVTTPSHAGLNQAARDGKLQFTVNGVTCGKATEGDGSLVATAQGQYCEVSLTVRNVGNDARVFSGAFQEAKDSSGNTYRDDTEAEAYANGIDQTFFNRINPGNEVKGVLIFDVPKGGKIVSLELHDSPLSAGVVVSVG